MYGDNYLSFGALVVICAGLGLISLRKWQAQPNARAKAGKTSVAAACFAVVAAYLLNAHLFSALSAVRFSCPILIGAFAVVCLATIRLRTLAKPNATNYAFGVGMFAMAIVIFFGSFRGRVLEAIHYRALLAYPVNPSFSEYSAARLSRQDAGYYLSLQARMAPGATALVWAVAPFHMDFARNHLLTISEGGLTSPLLHFPAGLNLEPLQEYLREWNIRYVMVETDLLGPKDSDFLRSLLKSDEVLYQKWGEFSLYFRQSLFDLARRHHVIYQDDRMLLFELAQNPREPATLPTQAE